MMRHTVIVDNGDHWQVLADYSASPRHSFLSGKDWSLEFSTHPSYAAMRASSPGAVGALSPQGCGMWLKDWSGPWIPPKNP